MQQTVCSTLSYIFRLWKLRERNKCSCGICFFTYIRPFRGNLEIIRGWNPKTITVESKNHHCGIQNTSLWNPKNISVDFEGSAFSSLKEVFTAVEIQGCYFHIKTSGEKCNTHDGHHKIINSDIVVLAVFLYLHLSPLNELDTIYKWST